MAVTFVHPVIERSSPAAVAIARTHFSTRAGSSAVPALSPVPGRSKRIVGKPSSAKAMAQVRRLRYEVTSSHPNGGTMRTAVARGSWRGSWRTA